MKTVLGSPRFWAAILAIVFVIFGTYLPAASSKLSQADVTSAVIALAAFIAAVSATGQPSGKELFSSLRFWALVTSLIFIFIRAFVPGFIISETLIQDLIATLGTVSIGASYRPIGTSKIPSDLTDR